jgi:hypothetical protein
MRAHEAVVNLAVDRELLGMNILQAILLGAREDEVRSLIEFGGGRHAVQTGHSAQIFVWRCAARLIAQHRPLLIRQKGALRPGRATDHRQQHGRGGGEGGCSAQRVTSLGA